MSDQDGTTTDTVRSSSPRASRLTLSDAEIEKFTAAEFITRWRQQDTYVTSLEQRLAQQEGETAALRDSDDRLRNLYMESQQREKVLVRRLAAKEQEMQDCVCQLAELKASQAPNNQALRSTLLDPSVNVLLQLLRQELTTTRTRLEETQNELSAWKFTPDSNTGKRLMAKCRQLYQENEELGKMTSSGRLAKLEGELALQKSFSEEVKKSQMELDEFVQDLDEDVEGMQSTIYYLQQELRKSNETVAALQLENGQLRSVRVNGTTHPHPNQTTAITATTTTTTTNGRTTTGGGGGGAGDTGSVCDRRTDSPCASATDSEPELIIKVSEQEMCCDGDEDITQTSSAKTDTVIVVNNNSSSSGSGGGADNNDNNGNSHSNEDDDSVVVVAAAGGGDNHSGGGGGNNKRAYEDSDSSTQDNNTIVQQQPQLQHRTSSSRTTKKVRRSSVLSLDYNDDDALVISTNGDVAISDAE